MDGKGVQTGVVAQSDSAAPPAMNGKTWIGLLLCLAIPTLSRGQAPISLKSLLYELVDNAARARFGAPAYTEHQQSSYDRHSVSPGQPGWFANGDFSQYVRQEVRDDHTEQVMLDVDGPGAIVRCWLTTTEKRDGILRIYLDGRSTPSLEIRGFDLMKSGLPLVIPHSSYEPHGKGGSTLYLPLPYEKHCTVTWEEGDTAEKPPRYYQINYRSYAAGTPVKTFDPSQLTPLKGLIARIQDTLWHPSMESKEQVAQAQRNLPPGATLAISLPAGSAAVTLLRAMIAGKDPSRALRAAILKITFDGHTTVLCPLGDFSGSGAGGRPLQSWYRTVTTRGEVVSRWRMPYQNTATVTLVNQGDDTLMASLAAYTEKSPWTAQTMYFHSSWKRVRDEPITKWDSAGARELNFIAIRGRGLYVGNTLSVYNHMHSWYGEGDQKIWVDAAPFPVEFGTGTEDYYNTSWAPVVLYQTPFANAPRADHPDSYGFNTFTRTRNLDAVPFLHRFQMTLEMLGWQTGTADFAITTYWYGFPGCQDNTPPIQKKTLQLP